LAAGKGGLYFLSAVSALDLGTSEETLVYDGSPTADGTQLVDRID
jgi:hypothetical protein